MLACLAVLLMTADVAQNAPIVIPMTGSSSDADQVSYPTLCTGEDRLVFNANSDKTGKTVSVCMIEGAHTSPGHLTRRYGRVGRPELEYPASAKGSAQQFTMRRYTRAQVTHLKFEFSPTGVNCEILDGGMGGETFSALCFVRLSDGTIVAEHSLTPDTRHLSLMALDHLVRTAPYDE